MVSAGSYPVSVASTPILGEASRQDKARRWGKDADKSDSSVHVDNKVGCFYTLRGQTRLRGVRFSTCVLLFLSLVCRMHYCPCKLQSQSLFLGGEAMLFAVCEQSDFNYLLGSGNF